MNSNISAEGKFGSAGALIGAGKNPDKHKSYAINEIKGLNSNFPNPPKSQFLVSATSTKTENFWKRRIKGYDVSYRFGTNDSSPWIWDSKIFRPRLYWEK